MADNYAYLLNGKAYINLTDKCPNACAFCIRNTGDGVKDIPLWLDSEPTADDVLAAFRSLNYAGDEVVFCGFGEPTERVDVLKEVAAALKAEGYKTRLNTNGLGSLINGRDITPELGDVDVFSVSLNNYSAQKYLDITSSRYGLEAFPAVLEFSKKLKAAGKSVVFTVVDVIGKDDIERCGALCNDLGIALVVREYIKNNYN